VSAEAKAAAEKLGRLTDNQVARVVALLKSVTK
jgi:hypothetical protein